MLAHRLIRLLVSTEDPLLPYTKHVTNAEVGQVTQCQPVSDMVRASRLRFFGHVAQAASAANRSSSSCCMGCNAEATTVLEATSGEAKLDMATSGRRRRPLHELRHPYHLAKGSRPKGTASHRGHSNERDERCHSTEIMQVTLFRRTVVFPP